MDIPDQVFVDAVIDYRRNWWRRDEVKVITDITQRYGCSEEYVMDRIAEVHRKGLVKQKLKRMKEPIIRNSDQKNKLNAAMNIRDLLRSNIDGKDKITSIVDDSERENITNPFDRLAIGRATHHNHLKVPDPEQVTTNV